MLAIDQAFGEAASADTETVWQFADHVGTVRTVGQLKGPYDWDLLHRNIGSGGKLGTSFYGTNQSELGDTTSAALEAVPTIFAGHQYDLTLDFL